MRGSSWHYYGVKLVYQAIITGSPNNQRHPANAEWRWFVLLRLIRLLFALSLNHQRSADSFAQVAGKKDIEAAATYKYKQHILFPKRVDKKISL